MKKIFITFVFLSIAWSKEVPFKAGESLQYIAEFNFIPVGQAELYVTGIEKINGNDAYHAVSYTHLRAHETGAYLVCRLLLEKKK